MKMQCIINQHFKKCAVGIDPLPQHIRTRHMSPKRDDTNLNEDTDTEAGEHEQPDNGGRVDRHVVHHLTDTHLSVRF